MTGQCFYHNALASGAPLRYIRWLQDRMNMDGHFRGACYETTRIADGSCPVRRRDVQVIGGSSENWRPTLESLTEYRTEVKRTQAGQAFR